MPETSALAAQEASRLAGAAERRRITWLFSAALLVCSLAAVAAVLVSR